jgi:putative NADH-flavin reductase
MKVLVLGAVSETGRAVVEKALAAGHQVTAAVPRGGQLTPGHERLTVLVGDPADQSFVDTVVRGQEAVVSVVGVNSRRPTTVYSETAANVVAALEKAVEQAKPGRVVCLSSSEVDADGPGLSLFHRTYRKLIIHRRYRNLLNDMSRMEDELRRSDLDWTVLRPARLRHGPSTGRYRTAIGARVPDGRALFTGDLGHYLATRLDDRATYRNVVELAY